MKKLIYKSIQGSECPSNQDTVAVIESNAYTVHGVFDGSSSRANSGAFVNGIVDRLEFEFEESSLKDCSYSDVIPTAIKCVNAARKLLAYKYPAAGCSFVLLVDITGHPFTYTIWAGDCRLGVIGKKRTTWKTSPHLLKTCLSQNTLTNCLLAKRPCHPSGMVMARTKALITLVSDGEWKQRSNDDATALVLAP